MATLDRGPRRAARSSSSSTGGTTATRTRSSSGRRSARTSATGPDGRAARPRRACRWPSGSCPESRDPSPTSRAPTRARASPTTDREHDCVPEISAVGLPSALANSVTFTITPYTPAMIRRALLLGLAVACACLGACSSSPAAPTSQQTHSSPIAVSPDGSRLFVVHPDADSVSVDRPRDARRSRTRSSSRAPRPAVDPTTQRFDPGGDAARAGARFDGGDALRDRAAFGRALRDRCGRGDGEAERRGLLGARRRPRRSRRRRRLRGVRAGRRDRRDRRRVALGRRDGDDAAKAMGARVGPDGKTLLATHLLGPGVSELATSPLALKTTWTVPDRGPETDPTEPHGARARDLRRRSLGRGRASSGSRT